MGIEAAVIGSAVVGGMMQKKAADKQAAAMQQASAAQLEASRQAAEEARFRPVGITTRFGSATPQFTDGRLSGYSYQATPEVLAFQDQLARLYGGSLQQAEQATALQPQFQQAATGLLGLGQQYLAKSPEEARQTYLQQQMDVLRPYDIEEEQRLASSVFGRGRGGLSVGAGGQPELQALAESRRRRDLQLAAQAEQAAQQRTNYGAGLFTTGAGLLGTGYQTQTAALSPFMSQFGAAQQLEETAQQPMQIGAALGSSTAQFGGQAAQLLQGGATAAANLQSQAAQAKAQGLAGLGQGISDVGMMYGMRQQPATTGGAGINQVPGLMGRTAYGNPYTYGSSNATSWKNYP